MYLFSYSILIQNTCNNQSNVRSGVVPLQWCKCELVLPQHPLICLVNRVVDIVGGNRYIQIAASALRSPCVEGEGDIPLDTLVR
jgi:hypothetical protein